MKRVLFLVLMVLAKFAWAGAMAGGATEWTQLANNLQLIMSYEEQAQQTIHQFNQYQAMLRNLQRLSPNGLLNSQAQKLWQDSNMSGAFSNLYKVVVNGQRIAYSGQNLDSQLSALNPGYGSYLASKGFDMQSAYKNWSDNTRQATMSALSLTSAHAEDIQSEADMMSQLSQQSDSVDGQVQAIQAGNRIGIQMVSQMQKLRELQMAQMQAQNVAALSKNAQDSAQLERNEAASRGACNRILTPQQVVAGESCKK